MSMRNLSLVTLILFCASYAAHVYESKRNINSIQGTSFVASLDIEKISTIAISSREGGDTLIEKDGTKFFVSTAKNFPAENEKINEFLEAILNIKLSKLVVEKAKPLDLEKYELSANKSKAVVKIFDVNKKLLLDLTIGKEVDSRGNFVSDNQAGKIFLTDMLVNLPAKEESFISAKILPLSSSDIKIVRRLSPNLEQIELVEDRWRDLSGKVVEESEAMNFISEITSLKFENYELQDNQSNIHNAFPITFDVITRDLVTYQFNLGTDGKKTYAKVKAIAPDVAENIVITTETEKSDLNKVGDAIIAKQKGETFNALKSPWIFELSKDVFNFIESKFPVAKKPEKNEKSGKKASAKK